MSDEMFDNDLFQSLPQAQDLREYVEDGRPTNHFLTALLQNDLMACIARADAHNKAALEDYVIWLKSYALTQLEKHQEVIDALAPTTSGFQEGRELLHFVRNPRNHRHGAGPGSGTGELMY